MSIITQIEDISQPSFFFFFFTLLVSGFHCWPYVPCSYMIFFMNRFVIMLWKNSQVSKNSISVNIVTQTLHSVHSRREQLTLTGDRSRSRLKHMRTEWPNAFRVAWVDFPSYINWELKWELCVSLRNQACSWWAFTSTKVLACQTSCFSDLNRHNFMTNWDWESIQIHPIINDVIFTCLIRLCRLVQKI